MSNKLSNEEQQAWDRFAAAVLTAIVKDDGKPFDRDQAARPTTIAAQIADLMLVERRRR